MGENQQITRHYKQCLLSHLVPRTDDPQCAGRFFLSSSPGIKNWKKYRVTGGNMKVFLGPLGGRRKTCCAEFSACEMDWDLRKPFLPSWLRLRPVPKGKLALTTGPQLHERDKKGLSLYPGSWPNTSSALKLRVPLPVSSSERDSVCLLPHGEQTLELPILQDPVKLDHCLPQSLQNSSGQTTSPDPCNCALT